MNISTFNVNSIRARLQRVLEWVDAREPDVLCMQELKCQEVEFPRGPFEERGYQLALACQKTYNGVAILSRKPLDDVRTDLPWPGDAQARGISAVVDGIRLVNLYVVNGESLQSDKYAYKLQWLERWYAWMGELAASDRRAEAGPPAPGDGGGVEAQRPLLTPGEWPARPTIVCGDFNLAPEDRDCWDPKGYAGHLFCSPPERDAFGRVKALGLTDAWRHHHPDKVAFTWWDYRGNGFGLDQGLRIDHFLVSRDVLARSVTVSIDREERGRPGASDHSPVTLHLAD